MVFYIALTVADADVDLKFWCNVGEWIFVYGDYHGEHI